MADQKKSPRESDVQRPADEEQVRGIADEGDEDFDSDDADDLDDETDEESETF
jgi:hypothetical protein